MPTILITGGAGFIGSNFARYWRREHPEWDLVIYDKLTYAGNRNNLRDLDGQPQVTFVQGDLCDREQLDEWVAKADIVVNFAAETHVDRSLLSSGEFVRTDVLGVHTLMECARQHHTPLIVHISTDEVYGPVLDGKVAEDAPLRPTSPYAASKAGGDLLAQAYAKSFRLPVLITRCCNNFGPFQHPEKFIPLMVTNALLDLPLPVYGDGQQVREWIFVDDHCRALDFLIEHGTPGEVYNIGTGQERRNIEVVRFILRHLGKPESLLRFVADRPAHDRRYAVNWDKLRSLGWEPIYEFEAALAQTIDWYRTNEWWWRQIREDEEFQRYYEANYEWRLKKA
jgi:dTDP-glucose 4,6-dehydratase